MTGKRCVLHKAICPQRAGLVKLVHSDCIFRVCVLSKAGQHSFLLGLQRRMAFRNALVWLFRLKIAATLLLWVLPLLALPYAWLGALGFQIPEPQFYARLLGAAYAALVVGYYGGLEQLRRDELPTNIIRMGIVSNGAAAAILSLVLLWFPPANLLTGAYFYASLLLVTGIALGLWLWGIHLQPKPSNNALGQPEWSGSIRELEKAPHPETTDDYGLLGTIPASTAPTTNRTKPLRRWVAAIIEGGITAETDPPTRKYLLLSNTLAMLSLLLTVAHIPFLVLVWQPALQLPVAVLLGGAAGYTAVLWLIRSGHNLSGRILLHIVSPVMITASAFLFGPIVGAHWYLVLVLIAALFTFAPQHNILRYALVLSAALTLLLLELYFQKNEGMVLIEISQQRLLGVVVRVGLVTGIVSFLAYVNYNYERTEANLELEKSRSDQLLLNVFPATIAQSLRSGEGNTARSYESASVLFADIVGFTPLAEKLSAQELVDRLGELFSIFDGLVTEHGVEKIKTIGDAYMVASGVPQARKDHAAALADFALAMRAEVAGRSPFGPGLALRIGLHCGPVMAGVIGQTRFLFDLWGDTVNTAARMESHGLPGQIQTTRAMRDALAGAFFLETRGLLPIKGKGEMEVFLLQKRR